MTRILPTERDHFYVNGAWADKTQIPADQPSAGVSFDIFNLTPADG